MAPESGGNEQNLASLVQFLSWNSKQLMQKSSLNFDKYCLHLLVREAEVQKYMSTYHIEEQFHFALKLSVTCLI